MPFIPYIHFEDCCAEAMAFYMKVFGGSDMMSMTYHDAPEDAGMPPSDRIMHAQFALPDGSLLMASDNPVGLPGLPQQAVSVSYSCDTVERAKGLYDQLNEGGEVIMPFEATFFSQGFGMTKDRFGTHWMIMGPDAT